MWAGGGGSGENKGCVISRTAPQLRPGSGASGGHTRDDAPQTNWPNKTHCIINRRE